MNPPVSSLIETILSKQKLLILAGVTAAGKTALALEVVEQLQKAGQSPEIINSDSLLVYKGLNIGTAKPTPSEQKRCPHHLIDILEPNESYTAPQFVRDAETAISQIISRNGIPLIVGGTGFYLKALLYGIWEAPPTSPETRKPLETLANEELHRRLSALAPIAAQKIHQNDRYRLIRALEIATLSGEDPGKNKNQVAEEADPRFEVIFLDRPNDELSRRIRKRAEMMVEAGLVEETRTLLSRWGKVRPLQSVGYAETLRFLEQTNPPGRTPRPGLEGLIDEITLGTQQLVKAQRTFFKGQIKI